MLKGRGEVKGKTPRLQSKSLDANYWSFILPKQPRDQQIISKARIKLPKLELQATQCSPRKPGDRSARPCCDFQLPDDLDTFRLDTGRTVGGGRTGRLKSLSLDSVRFNRLQQFDSSKFSQSDSVLAIQYIQLLNAVLRFHLETLDLQNKSQGPPKTPKPQNPKTPFFNITPHLE